MYINNVTLDDDNLFGHLGSYECHAFAVDVIGRDMALVLVLSQVSHTFLFAAVSKLYLSFFASNIEICT